MTLTEPHSWLTRWEPIEPRHIVRLGRLSISDVAAYFVSLKVTLQERGPVGARSRTRFMLYAIATSPYRRIETLRAMTVQFRPFLIYVIHLSRTPLLCIDPLDTRSTLPETIPITGGVIHIVCFYFIS
jgi:hypothetical protein